MHCVKEACLFFLSSVSVFVCVCVTWYILKGMYLKPPSSVGYSISFLFMAQNWSNLSVKTQMHAGQLMIRHVDLINHPSSKHVMWNKDRTNFFCERDKSETSVNHTPKTSTRISLKLAIDKFSALTNRKNVDWRFISIINLWMSCVVFCDSEENENDPAVFATAVTAITHLSFNFKDT